MPTRSQSRTPFQLEALETRTLLAGDISAITSTGAFITNFSPESTSSRVTIASVEGGELNIDSALLPNTVKELTISGFTSVTITGTDGFQKLVLSDIGSFTGTQIAVTAELKASEVSSLTLQSIAGMARLYGEETRLEVVDARSATILSDVDHLVVSSNYHMDLWAAEPNQELRFEFRLDQFKDRAELESFLEQFKDRSNILDFKVIFPEAPPKDTEGEPDSSFSFYVVIVISVSSANAGDFFLMRLQDTLKSGDPESVKSALLDYIKSVSLSESPYATSLLENKHTDFDAIGYIDSTTTFEPTEPERLDVDVLSPLNSRLQISSFEPTARVAGVLGRDFAEEQLPPDGVSLMPLEIPLVRPQLNEDSHGAQGEFKTDSHDWVFDRIRSTLSSTLSNVDMQAASVSGYIIDRLGHELEPGVLPGLLVDSKAVRSRRDFGWMQL